MPTMIDAVYENGVLKPLVVTGLKEQQRYRLLIEETSSSEMTDDLKLDPALAAEIERRTTILADGRRLIRVGGLFSADLSDIPESEDPVAGVLAELRRERAKRLTEEWPETAQPEETS